jgi:hypothetical protein
MVVISVPVFRITRYRAMLSPSMRHGAFRACRGSVRLDMPSHAETLDIFNGSGRKVTVKIRKKTLQKIIP